MFAGTKPLHTFYKKIENMYQQNRNVPDNIIFPAFLILYPLLRIRQGIDVLDTTYSLANFQYFTSMDGTWMIATFLANVVGRLLMCLPFGGTLMGMYFYTALIQSATAVLAYKLLKRRIPAPLVFVGEVIALGLCWCSSTVLYNYLTYFLMTAAVLLLYEGILCENKEIAKGARAASGGGIAAGSGDVPRGRAYRKYYVAAGICLGGNVAVRMPNVVQMAFIVAVWYAALLYGGKEKWRRIRRDTLWCIAGYLIGFGIPFGVICVRYGIGAYPSMVQTMFAMTEKATDYKPTSMLTGMFSDYLVGLYWLAFAGICMAGGWVLFRLKRKFFAKSRQVEVVCKFLYAAVLLTLLRFYWGRGVFNFCYYEYRSMYYPAVLFLLVAVFMAVFCLCKKGMPDECKIAAVLVLVQMLVTPLGSNNYLYPIINNMFMVTPFVLWIGFLRGTAGSHRAEELAERDCETEDCENIPERERRRESGRVIWGMPFLMLVAFVLIQSVGFHARFAFQDGIWGEKRDTMVEAPTKAAKIYTRADNAAWLSELAQYVEEEGLAGRQVLLYGDIPGLGYLLDMPSALSTFWPDLDSYRMVEYERDMEQIEEMPVIIVASPIAAYLGEDADGMNWFGVDQAALDGDDKLQILGAYMKAHSYQETFGNGGYVVYMCI